MRSTYGFHRCAPHQGVRRHDLSSAMRTTPSSAFSMSHEARAFLTISRNECASSNLRCTRTNPADPLLAATRPSNDEKLGEGSLKPSTSSASRTSARDHANGARSSSGARRSKKRMRAKLLAIKIELRRIMHDPIAKTGAWVKQMLKGHLNYFAVSGNHPSLWWFFNKGEAALARVAQAAQPNGTPQLGEVHPVRRPLLSANQNDTPAALSPLRRQNPREEPGALAAHAGICTGCALQAR